MHLTHPQTSCTTRTPPQPTSHSLRELDFWLGDEKGGDCFQKGTETLTWSDDNDPTLQRSSFVCLQPKIGDSDFVTQLLTRFVRGIKNSGSSSTKKAVFSCDDSKINTAKAALTMTVSSMLPVAGILVLYDIQNPYGRIGVTIALIGLFAAILAIFTEARKVEIFAATAT
jgi:hypothetical protein